MLAYNLYKKRKQSKAASEAAAISSPSVDGDTATSEQKLTLEDTQEENADALPRTDTHKTFTTVTKDKRARRRQLIFFGVVFFVDVIMPIILYYSLRSSVSQLAALLISSAPPAVMSIIEIVWYRTINPLGLVIIFGFVISAAISVIDGNPRVLLLRESIVTCATGLLFLLSMIPFRYKNWTSKPLTYGVTRQMMSLLPPVKYVYQGEVVEESRFEFCWRWSPVFKRGMLTMNAAWGVILILEFVAKLAMYFSSLTVDQMVTYGNIVLGVTLGAMGVFNAIYGRMIRLRSIEECKVVQKRLEEEAEQQHF
ncbi:hypothetical protein INT44_000433 [Umbelopsis vinacea]|uniref:Uncharacterized protein n=1 Tax=Umbelopsis vinacea TaxID=44442 RepID=A0A8H7UAQ6_9FUNG|nr:hypothetical protein INT44_000433 [Umbelopsis vinacea]